MYSHLQHLRMVSLFRDLTNEELELIHDFTITRAYQRKEIVFTEGSDKEAIFFIRDGLIKAFKTDENGNEHIVSFLKTGDMFPHTGFFNEQAYPATTEAIVDTQLLAIPVRSFEQLMNQVPVIATKVMRVMGEKIVELQQKLQQLTGHDVQERGLLFLQKLAEKSGVENEGSIHIHLPMTNQEIASTIGTTRETVNRLINKLRKEHIIEMNREGFIIHDLNRLRQWGQK